MSKERRIVTQSEKYARWGYAFITPWIIGFLVFTFIPMVFSMYLAFTDYDTINAPKWIGLQNFVKNELYSFLSDTDSNDLLKDLNDFLSTLNLRDRSVFIRRYYYLESNITIAENYGISESNVRIILMRTRKKFKNYLKEMSL